MQVYGALTRLFWGNDRCKRAGNQRAQCAQMATLDPSLEPTRLLHLVLHASISSLLRKQIPDINNERWKYETFLFTYSLQYVLVLQSTVKVCASHLLSGKGNFP